MFEDIKPIYDYDKMIELALASWYPKEHPLHLDPLHPAMGLVGEVGEWINLLKKDKFKPGFQLAREAELDKLGDIWRYLRILAYLNEEAEIIEMEYQETKITVANMLVYYASKIYTSVNDKKFRARKTGMAITGMSIHLNTRLKQINSDINELTHLNHEKLKWQSDWEKEC